MARLLKPAARTASLSFILIQVAVEQLAQMVVGDLSDLK